MAISYRLKCSACKSAVDLIGGKCPKCNAQHDLSQYGFVDLYRMGNMVGMAAGFEIYIDGDFIGLIGNTQTVRLCLPYGTHNIHIACSFARKCKDYQFTLSPEQRHLFCKCRMKVGAFVNSYEVIPCTEADMPVHEPIPQGAPSQPQMQAQSQMTSIPSQPVQSANKTLACPYCNGLMQVPASMSNVNVSCPHCNKTVAIS